MSTDERVELMTRRTYLVDREDLVVRQHAGCYEVYMPDGDGKSVGGVVLIRREG